MARAQITQLLDNDLLARIEQLRLVHGHGRTNRGRGEQLSRRGGSSIEFRDYRDYVPGDDIRFVDWNIFARLQRPYVRLFHDEEEIHVALLVDASASMVAEKKFERARQFAATLGVMALLGGERLSVHAFGSGTDTVRLEPSRGRVSLRRLFAALEGIEPGGDVPVETGIEAMLRVHSGRGSMCIVSDFLTLGELRGVANKVFQRGLAVSAIQVLAGAELEPELSNDVRLVDCETAATLDVSGIEGLLSIYGDYLRGYQLELNRLCLQRGGRYLLTDTREPLAAEIGRLRREGWVR